MRNLIIVLLTIVLVIILQFEFELVALGVIWFFIRRRFKSNKPIPIDDRIKQYCIDLTTQLEETSELLRGWFKFYPEMTDEQIENSRVIMRDHLEEIDRYTKPLSDELYKNHHLRSDGSDHKTLNEMREKEFKNI